ncbi:RNA-directed DNA polymerase, eukaryota [Tanacetum coccineum]
MEQELRLKREAAERAFEAQAEKDRTLMRLEELSMVSKGLGHRTERAKEAGQKETDSILDCLKNAKDNIIELESMNQEKGEKYIKVAGKEDDPSSFMGSSWKSAYKTDDKNVVDQMAAKMGKNLEWIGNAAKIITGLVSAIRFHKETQRKTWFNSLEDLWKACNDYGTVVDVFIPNKRSKTGKRFAFVRFIKVTNLIRLVENLNTIWLGRLHLSANFARFDRPIAPLAQKAKQVIFHNEGFHNTRIVYLGGLWVLVELNSSKSKLKFMKHVGVASWFSHLCNAQSDFVAKERIAWVDIEGVPLNAWSRLTFQKIASKWGEMVDLEEGNDDLFARKRICVKTNHVENILESFKLVVKGKVFWARAKELFVWSPSFKEVPTNDACSDDGSVKVNEEVNGFNNGDEESDNEAVSDTYFGDNGEDQGCEQPHGESKSSPDPFNIYDILDKRSKVVRPSISDSSIPYPPGFTPLGDEQVNTTRSAPVVDSKRSSAKSLRSSSRVLDVSAEVENTDNGFSDSIVKGFKPKEGGSILEILEEMIMVGQTMGFSMEGCTKDMEKIIGSQGEQVVFR